MKTLLKLGLVAAVTTVCLCLSINAIQSHLRTATEQERSLADLLVQQQLQEQLAVAAAKVEAEVETQNLVIEQGEVELKEPIPEPEPEVEAPSEEEEPLPEQTPDTTHATDDATDTDTAQVPTITYTEALDLSEIDDVEGYLIEHYFLNGYDYAAAETDPILKAEKELACAMEAYVIDTIETLTGLTNVLSNFDLEQTQAIDQQMRTLHQEFQGAYGYLVGDGTFGAIYDATDDYFVQATTLTSIAVTMLTDLKSSTNGFMALTVLMQELDSKLYPQIDVVLDAVFTMKELTNAVYLQNTSATMLSKEDAQTLVAELETVLLTW